MPRTEDDVVFETEQSKLAKFLLGSIVSPSDDERLRAWNRAHVMLRAEELLDACEFALTTMQMISSEQFTGGGDAIARDRLAIAIQRAGQPFTSVKRERECRRGIEESIRLAQERQG
jgi:hypothetical protein